MRESNGITGGTVMEQPIYLWLDERCGLLVQ